MATLSPTSRSSSLIVRLKAAFPQNYISSYNYVVKNKGKTVDGIHYMPDTYRMIYRFLDSVV